MFGYVAKDGRPLVVPVWFIVDDGQLVFNTGRDSSKGHALERDSRVVLCVDDPRPPYSFVQVQGEATVSDDPDEVLAAATRTGARYMGADRAEDSVAATPFPANWWCRSARPRSSRASISAPDAKESR
jgi:PPOX class probable F420-dependent enzyme